MPGAEASALTGQRVCAFAGIATPEKFFTTLAEAGAVLAARLPFPDHHRYSVGELQDVLERAAQLQAVPVTTKKDAVRVPESLRSRIKVIGVSLTWHDARAIEGLLDSAAAAEVRPSLGFIRRSWSGTGSPSYRPMPD